jgi:hypothetical protein
MQAIAATSASVSQSSNIICLISFSGNQELQHYRAGFRCCIKNIGHKASAQARHNLAERYKHKTKVKAYSTKYQRYQIAG